MQAVFHRALNAAHCKAAVVRDVGRLGGPGRQGAQPRRNQQYLATLLLGRGLAVGKQSAQALLQSGLGRTVGGDPMDIAGIKCADFVVNSL